MTTQEDRDAAQRIADQYNLHRVADPYGSVGKWFAARLQDGVSNGELYDTKPDAIRHQVADEKYYVYLQIVPTTMPVKDALAYLSAMRTAYERGLRHADRDAPGGGRDMIRRLTREDQHNGIRAFFHGDRKPSNLRIGREN